MRLARLLKGAHRLWPPTREEAGEKGRLMLLPRRHWLPSAGNNAVLFSPGSSSDQQNGPALLLLGFGDNAQFCHTSSLPPPVTTPRPFSSPTLRPTTQWLYLPSSILLPGAIICGAFTLTLVSVSDGMTIEKMG